MTPEGKIKKKVKDWLDEIGAYYFMPVQTGYGKKTLDFLCCIKGRFVAIETKAPKRNLTPLQELIARTIEAGFGIVWLINSDADLTHYKIEVKEWPNGR